ncbi:MAG: hypothetical protein GYB36_08870 [Alphaproteobacteria bacterium]|nr:hypothetical protein [Alphaproteobacteria bacterium]
MAQNATLFVPCRTGEIRRQIDETLLELRVAQGEGGHGPRILYTVNELAVLYEDLFETLEQALSEQDGSDLSSISFQHEAFLADFCDLADEIRALNGEVPNAFFALLRDGPYAGPAIAA